jgi:hypothetical protein
VGIPIEETIMARDAVKFTNLKGFEKDLEQFVENFELEFGTAIKKISVDAYTGITIRTPVDTGRARASWNIASGNEDDSVEDEDFGGGAKKANTKNNQKLDSFLGVVTGVPYSPIYITNNLPYIIALEKGHSTQMEAGYMVERTLVDLHASIKKALS